MGMIGGGPGAFIGAVHRMAARLDGEIELVCGAFSSDEKKSKEFGTSLGLDDSRVYRNYEEMIIAEAGLPLQERIHFVSIVTPNHVHFGPASLAIKNGFHVVLDKPMTFDLAEAEILYALVKSSGLEFCLTHTYTGYPMIREARELVRAGKFGKIRKVYVEYPQGWLANYIEGSNQKQAAWRTDPTKSGIAGAMGDIGTHAFNLAEYVSGLEVEALCADINIVVEKRQLDDDGAVLLKFNNGASGVLIATQVAAGEENNLRIRVYGEKGGIDWQQADANSILVKWADQPTQVYRAGQSYLSKAAQHNCRVPPGHPEGYIEAFANHYRNFALTVKAKMNGEKVLAEWEFPGVEEGVRGMRFVEKVIESGKSERKWISF
jgi:predicted dehydrogenase